MYVCKIDEIFNSYFKPQSSTLEYKQGFNLFSAKDIQHYFQAQWLIFVFKSSIDPVVVYYYSSSSKFSSQSEFLCSRFVHFVHKGCSLRSQNSRSWEGHRLRLKICGIGLIMYVHSIPFRCTLESLVLQSLLIHNILKQDAHAW